MKTCHFICIALSCISVVLKAQTPASNPSQNNLAKVAVATSSSRGGSVLPSLNDGLTPAITARMQGQGGNRPQQRPGLQWVQYEWTQPVTTGEISVFWWNFGNTVKLPNAYRLKYWNGSEFIPVKNPSGLGLENNKFNNTTFDPVHTSRLRLEVDSAERFTATLLEWIVLQSPGSPGIPPVVNAGGDRSVMTGGKTYLSGKIRSVTPVSKTVWNKVSGPGDVIFKDKNSLVTD